MRRSFKLAFVTLHVTVAEDPPSCCCCRSVALLGSCPGLGARGSEESLVSLPLPASIVRQIQAGEVNFRIKHPSPGTCRWEFPDLLEGPAPGGCLSEASLQATLLVGGSDEFNGTAEMQRGVGGGVDGMQSPQASSSVSPRSYGP